MVRRILRAEWLFRRGQKLAAQGHFDEAIEAFARAQELRPGAAGIYLHHALALAETSRWPEAGPGSPAGYGFTACQPCAAHVFGAYLFGSRRLHQGGTLVCPCPGIESR